MKPKISYPTHLKKEPKRNQYTSVLGLIVVFSLSLAVLAISSLEWEDSITITRGFSLFLLGLVFFTSLYYFLNNAAIRTSLGQKFMKKYKLNAADVFDVNNKVVSAVQALLCCLTGITVCCYSCPRNLLHTSHYISEAYAWFGAAYFFYDIWSMYKVHCTVVNCNQMNGDVKSKSGNFKKFARYIQQNPMIVGHHLFIGGFGFLVITYLRGGLGDCVFGFVFLMEASTPFVSLRGILSRFGLKSSKLYVVNGLVMLASFFICRVAMFPYVLYMYAKFIRVDYLTAIQSLPTGCKVSMSILLIPQFYWFFLMLKGAKQVLNPKRSTNSTNTNNTKKKRHLNSSSS